jgi:hypothetical protein
MKAFDSKREGLTDVRAMLDFPGDEALPNIHKTT